MWYVADNSLQTEVNKQTRDTSSTLTTKTTPAASDDVMQSVGAADESTGAVTSPWSAAFLTARDGVSLQPYGCLPINAGQFSHCLLYTSPSPRD